MAAAGIGAGDIVSATMAASRHGLALLWVVVLAAVPQGVLNEGIARWQLATGTTAVEGWCTHLPRWLRWYFLVYLVLWTVSVSAALTSACGLGVATLTGDLVPRPWGAVAHSLAGGALVAAGGFAGFEKVMKVLIGTMFFAILACAALTLRDPGAVVRGLVVPSVPAGDAASVLSVLGGIGGSIAMLAYSYWMREEQMAGPRLAGLRAPRRRHGLRLHGGVRRRRHGRRRPRPSTCPAWPSPTPRPSPGWPRPCRTRSDRSASTPTRSGSGRRSSRRCSASGRACRICSPTTTACSAAIPRAIRDDITTVTSRPYRLALLFVTIVPLPFAFVDQPLFIIRTFTIVGSLFIPFLAGTLLYLNNAKIPIDSGVPRNSSLTNAVLVLALLVFAAVGASEAGLLRW